jgi:ABC-type branched-subunit amino acid transport system substrate-binding protein
MTSTSNGDRPGGRIERRRVLKLAAGSAVVAASPFVFARNHSALASCAAFTGPVTLGFNVPLSGAYQHEGQDQLRALKLAAMHLNGEGDGGMIKTMKPSSLKGNGILGRKVAFVVGDSATKPDVAVASAKKLVTQDRAIMVTGGSSSAEAVAVQSYCHEAGIIFMAGLTHANDTTGKDRRRYGFRHFFNTWQSGAALAPVVAKAYGRDRIAHHLTADYNWGWSQQQSIKDATEKLGWKTAKTVLTPLGTKDFTEYLVPVLTGDADVLVLNHYGLDMAISLAQAVALGVRDRMVNGKQLEIVVPLYSRLMATAAWGDIEGILGTKNWYWTLPDAGSKAFVKSFADAYGFPPSQAAHTCYVQALLYANACEMAGTFAPPGVIKALEGFQFDGLGNGPTLYRAEDHQCFKNVLVVKGRSDPLRQYDLMEIVEEVPVAQVTYPADLLGGSLGEAKPC